MSQPDDWHDEALSRLYRQMPELTPDPATDAKILAAARRAVGAGPRRFRPWLGGLATAAVVVLAVTLRLEATRPGLATAAPEAAPAAASTAPAIAEAPAAADAKRVETAPQPAPLTAAPALPEKQRVQPQRRYAEPASPAEPLLADQPPPTAEKSVANRPAAESADTRVADAPTPQVREMESDSASRAPTELAAPAPAPKALLSAAPPAGNALFSDPAGNAGASASSKAAASPALSYQDLMGQGKYAAAWDLMMSADSRQSSDPWTTLDQDLLARLTGKATYPRCTVNPPADEMLRNACTLIWASPGSEPQAALRKKLESTLGRDAGHGYWWRAQRDLP